MLQLDITYHSTYFLGTSSPDSTCLAPCCCFVEDIQQSVILHSKQYTSCFLVQHIITQKWIRSYVYTLSNQDGNGIRDLYVTHSHMHPVRTEYDWPVPCMHCQVLLHVLMSTVLCVTITCLSRTPTLSTFQTRRLPSVLTCVPTWTCLCTFY